MAIPCLTAAGFLPPGAHDASMEEIGIAFGRFQDSERRITLFQRLSEYIAELRSLGHAVEVLLDGSFVSAKASPGDIDLIVVYPEAFNFSANLTPAEYNTIDRRRVRRMYGFDVAPVAAGSADLEVWKDYFSHDLRTRTLEKGLLQVRL
jgi:hypothetical protein